MTAPTALQARTDLPAALVLRDLLMGLPLWSGTARDRRAFLELALPGHGALADFQYEGPPQTVAAELVNRLHPGFEPLRDGTHPVAALVREVRARREDGNRETAGRIAALEGFFGLTVPHREPDPGPPYPGLEAFDWGRKPALARRFFGREPETQALLERLAAPAFGGLLIVSGPSGSGKSSLVKAGLWRALAETPTATGTPTPEPIPGCRAWVIASLVAGTDPFRALVDALAPHWQDGRLRPADEARRLRTDPAAFPAFLHRLLGTRPALLLILDQFEEVFTLTEAPAREAFIAWLLCAAAEARVRIVVTLRDDFQPQVNAHTGLRAVLNTPGSTYIVGAPGPLALARMIEGPAQAAGLACEPALTERLVTEAHREPGGLALLAAALQDTWLAAAGAPTLTLHHYVRAVGGIKGVLSRRGRRGLALLWPEGRRVLPRVFGRLIHVDPETGAATRCRVPLDGWPAEGPERRLIEVFARDADHPRDAVRLLVCGEDGGRPMVEVAHEALLREWPRLAVWIRTRREALIRAEEVRRDAARWDERGRPDHLLPHPELLAELRARLDAAGLWSALRDEHPRIAWFLAQDDPQDLYTLAHATCRRSGAAGGAPVLQVLAGLGAPGRTWETTAALGRLILAEDPGLACWLGAGLTEVLALLGEDDATQWHRRRLGIGDLLAALGDNRPGVGRRPDGLPDIDWVPVPPAARVPVDERRPRGVLARIGRALRRAGRADLGQVVRIARYPVTNAQYRAFEEAADYRSAEWWRGIRAPDPLPSPWPQPNRPRVYICWLEAMAYCRWLTAQCRARGLIAPAEQVRLPTEAEWEAAVRAGSAREYPWGDGYRPGYANVDETPGKSGPYSLRETTAVGLYPQGVSPLGLCDCAGNVWEWCLNKYTNQEDVDTSGDTGRALRGGSWNYAPAYARAPARSWGYPDDRNFAVGLRLVCACPIPLYTESLNSEH